jgi:hypothetical protein
MLLASGLVITDPGTNFLASASVSFTNWQAEDRVNFNNIFALQHTFTQDLVNHTATLSITGTDTLDHYQFLLRSVTYSDVSNNPVTTQRVASFTVNDGLQNSNAVTRAINVTAANDAPVLSAIETTPLAYKANDPAFPAQSISGTLLISDADSVNLKQATVKIINNYMSDTVQNPGLHQDFLSFTNQLGITGSFNEANGTLTLTGVSSISNYRTALRSVKFSTSGTQESTATRLLSIQVTDDSPTPLVSNVQNRSVTVSLTNLPPAVTGVPTSNLSYTRGAAATAVAPGLLVLDSDSINLSQATVQITSGFQTGLDVLSATTVTGITSSFNSTNGTLTLSGIASLASYKTVLDSVKFKTTAAANTTQRTVSFTVNDGLALSSPVVRNIVVH